MVLSSHKAIEQDSLAALSEPASPYLIWPGKVSSRSPPEISNTEETLAEPCDTDNGLPTKHQLPHKLPDPSHVLPMQAARCFPGNHARHSLYGNSFVSSQTSPSLPLPPPLFFLVFK